jgi:hypothetical protein
MGRPAGSGGGRGAPGWERGWGAAGLRLDFCATKRTGAGGGAEVAEPVQPQPSGLPQPAARCRRSRALTNKATVTATMARAVISCQSMTGSYARLGLGGSLELVGLGRAGYVAGRFGLSPRTNRLI